MQNNILSEKLIQIIQYTIEIIDTYIKLLSICTIITLILDLFDSMCYLYFFP